MPAAAAKRLGKNHRQGDRQPVHSPSLYARSMNKDKKSGRALFFSPKLDFIHSEIGAMLRSRNGQNRA
jgi:hypothetical protein